MVLVSLESLSVAVYACRLWKVLVGSSVLICGAGKLGATFSCCARMQIMQGFSGK